MLQYLVSHFFAGLWTLIWHFGVGIGVIILLCVGAYFAPTVRLKATCIALAVGVAMLVIGEGIGVRMERSHVAAQEKSANTFVDKTVKGTTDPKSRTAPDPWNSKDN